MLKELKEKMLLRRAQIRLYVYGVMINNDDTTGIKKSNRYKYQDE